MCALHCKEAILSESPESIRDWDYIEVGVGKAKRSGANLFVLDKKTCAVDTQHHHIPEELRKRGQEAIEIPHDAAVTWGGTFRCCHHPLI